MKFNFKIQQYQTDAVDAVVKVFNGQGYYDNVTYSRDIGKVDKKAISQTIDAYQNSVTFLNGDTLYVGDASGDVSEKDIRRIQIKETISSHFEKEKENFDKGIKTLSLFFIDEVANYRQYDEDGNELLGEYGKIFEEEYTAALAKYRTIDDTPYQTYLNRLCSDVAEVHKGYFSIDKKGRSINSEVKKGKEFSDDISAYDLILKNKERLLSFDEPTRFIFSHSALREGWDNPNVFQICTLKHSNSTTGQRQEVGRGLRLCVNQNGNRMDAESSTEVCVYAKLPKGFAIPTPVGNYSPDWAIAFNEGSVKHIFFVAETKGTMETLSLKPIEQAKISCAKKLFNEMSTANVKYHDVDSFRSLMNIMSSL